MEHAHIECSFKLKLPQGGNRSESENKHQNKLGKDRLSAFDFLVYDKVSIYNLTSSM